MTETDKTLEISEIYAKKEEVISYIALSEDLVLYIGTANEVKVILSTDEDNMYVGDTVTIVCTVLTKDNEPLKGVPVSLYKI